MTLGCLGLDWHGALVCCSAGLLQRLHHQSLRVNVGFRGHRANRVSLGSGGNIRGGHQDHGCSRGGQEELRERECWRGGGGGSYRSSGSNANGSLVTSLYSHGAASGLLAEVSFGHLLLLSLRLRLLLLGCLIESLLLLLLL